MAKPKAQKPFKLTLKAVVKANITALKKSTLGAATGKTDCYYVYPKRGDTGHNISEKNVSNIGCAIGVCLPADLRVRIASNIGDNGADFLTLKKSGFVTTEMSRDLSALQKIHDEWASSNHWSFVEIERAKKAYFRVLRRLAKKSNVVFPKNLTV